MRGHAFAVRDILRRAGFWLSPPIFVVGIVLDMLSLVQLGVSSWAFQGIAGAAFFASAWSIIASLRRENEELRGRLDDLGRRRIIAERLGEFLVRGDALTQHVAPERWEDECRAWREAVIQFLRTEGAAVEASAVAAASTPSRRPDRELHTAQWRELDRMTAQMEALRDIIARYR